ncbi:MAG: UDP-N-acetylmuramoyl-L-alanyl-D-glutamate--2,6-diaminopimelate ligase [Clostridia bacterium]|nr:UDP-N-acetylmuramoyl-L-alanyl-D-glutamate--2,6-diaminopimelate ligase [Clostridia bacterium]
MKLYELLSGIQYETSSDITDIEIKNICYDSRKADAGSVFVALRGASTDGHKFALSAYENGCRCFLLESLADIPDDAAAVYTDNTRAALGVISRTFFGHPERELRLIGITGTKGKTTTALMLCSIFSSAGVKCGYIGSNGVEYPGGSFATGNTTPESYELAGYFRQMVDAGVTHVVLEVSSQALFNYRVDGLTFDSCAFTNLSRDHISPKEHPTFEHYRDSKKRLFTDFSARFVAYSADDEHSRYMIEGCGALCRGFGIEEKTDVTAENIRLYSDSGRLGVCFTACDGEKKYEIKLRTPGEFSVYNALCAATVADWYGIAPSVIAEGLENCSPKGRFEVVETSLSNVVFIIDYAHNEMSLRHALSVIRKYSPRRLICVFGSVGERTQERREELARVSGELADLSVITSDNPGLEPPEDIIEEIASHLPAGAPHLCITRREDAVRFAVENASDGDVVLFAGKGHENYQLIGREKRPFRERELIVRFAEERSRHAFLQKSDKHLV